jgi:hypothetical protein
MTTCDDHRRAPVSAQESIRVYGRAYYDAPLGHDRHHYKPDCQPCWLPHECNTVVGLLAITGEARS